MTQTSARRAPSTRRLAPLRRGLALAALVVVIDRITKHLVVSGIAVGDDGHVQGSLA